MTYATQDSQLSDSSLRTTQNSAHMQPKIKPGNASQVLSTRLVLGNTKIYNISLASTYNLHKQQTFSINLKYYLVVSEITSGNT
jgi:hypothetical protein